MTRHGRHRPLLRRSISRRPLLESMESRLLYSADAVAAVAMPPPAVMADTAATSTPAPATAAGHELLFVDARVDHLDQLLADLSQQQANGRDLVVVVVQQDVDGIALVSQMLEAVGSGGSAVSAVHLVGHGDAGSLTLGASTIDQTSLRSRAADFSVWRDGLTEQADLLVYGCDFASGAIGQDAVVALAQLTGADVAASTDLTGAARYGADWTLEVQTGRIESALAFSLAEQARYDGVFATYTVTNTNDSGAGSLRQAISNANLNPGADTINFAIAGGGVHTITLASALPLISDAITIDGQSQSGWSAGNGKPLIEINGNGLAAQGLEVTASNVTIRGLTINRVTQNGIQVDGAASNITIQDNWIGLDNTGTVASANGSSAVWLSGNGSNILVGGSGPTQRNVLSGSTNFEGIAVADGSGAVIQGNYIGTNATGTASIGNGRYGVLVYGQASNTQILNNLVDGSGDSGIVIWGSSVTIQGNRVGVDVSGTIALGNANYGVVVTGAGTTIGGTQAGQGNVISGNTTGVLLTNGASSDVIEGNYIGTDWTGFAALGNSYAGVVIDGFAAGNTIGGTSAGARNIISGNGSFGIVLAGDNGPSGIVSRWTADNTMTDSVGTSNGTLVNGASYVQGLVGMALDLNGVNQYVSVADNAALRPSTFTLEAWANANSFSGNWDSLISKGSSGFGPVSSGFDSYLLSFVNGGHAVIELSTSNGHYVLSSAATYATGVWHHLAATYTGSVLTLYVDGVAVNSMAASGSILYDSGVPLLIGNDYASGPSGQVFNGLIDQAAIYNRALSAGEIAALYAGNGAGSGGNVIQGNYVGLTLDGAAALGNGSDGIIVGTANNVIGGLGSGGNVVSGNGWGGILLQGLGAYGNLVVGNITGLNAAGNAAIANASDGLQLWDGASGNQIGVSAAGGGNVSSGNTHAGIYLGGPQAVSANRIQGNYFGTDVTGTLAIGNATGGVALDSGVADNLVGGVNAGEGNLITGNTGPGIVVYFGAGLGNALLGNAIYGNTGLGIDLVDDGVTANDPMDPDSGTGALQNFPVLVNARTNASNQLTVSGTLNSTASSYFRIELFASSAQDGSGYGPGQRFVGYANVSTDGAGNASFSVTLSAVVAVGEFISATATRTDASFTAVYDTSEFARNIAAVASTLASITVDTASDTLDGDTTSLSTLLANRGADGKVSLREAILAANNTANGSGGADQIRFAIAGSGVQTISLSSLLPAVTDAVAIDATTQPGYGGTPIIRLLGNGTPAIGLTLNANGSYVTGLAIGGFGGAGIQVNGGSNTISGNYVGVAPDGTTVSANGTGVQVTGVGNVIVGNVIAGNTAGGVRVTGAGNQVRSNFIGVNRSNAVVANGGDGVAIVNAANNTVGGSSAGQGNVIGGNAGSGVLVSGAGSTGNIILGNAIGVSASTLVALANGADGIRIQSGASGTQIGEPFGNPTGGGNVVSGNLRYGLSILSGATGTQVQGNNFGTNDTGSVMIGNSLGGIYIDASANNTIGGTAAGVGNLVAGNGGNGVTLTAAAGSGNSLSSNLIYANAGLGIDLGADGVTANDAGDADTGPNGLQNFPVLTRTETDGSSLSVDGVLDSTASATFRVELYASTTADASGYGEGQQWLGSVTVSTDAGGHAAFSITLGVAVPVGSVISAIAVNTGNGNTSEFSLVRTAVAPLTPPALTLPGPVTAAEDTSAAIAGLSVNDVNGNLASLALSVLQGTLVVDLSGGASVSAGANSSAALTLAGSQAQINAALASLHYQGSANYNGSDTLSLTATDATALTSSGTVALTVTAVNDPPMLTTPAPQAVTEDGTLTLSNAAGNAIIVADVDANGAPVQMTLTGGNGRLTLAGTSGLSFSTGTGSGDVTMIFTGTLAAINAALDGLVFAPTANFSGAASISVSVSDQGNSGAGGTATTGASVAVTVTPVNDAPVLSFAGIVGLASTTEDLASTPTTVAAILTSAGWSDADVGAAKGIAVTAASGNAAWQYSLDGTTWTSFGTVSAGAALLLDGATQLRYQPDGLNGEVPTFQFRAWDQTTGVASAAGLPRYIDASVAGGGSSSLSTYTGTANLTVTSVNDAPAVGSAYLLGSIVEDSSGGAGTQVAAIAASAVDPDTGALRGIAVTQVDNSNGSWQFTTDGSTWLAIGNVSASSARLLAADASTAIRFVPNANFNGVVMLNYRMWDQTSGVAAGLADASLNGGTSAFSATQVGTSVTVTPVNDAPVLALPPAQTTPEDTPLVFSAAGGNAIVVSDVDAGAAPVQLTLTATNGLLTLSGTAGLSFSAGTGANDASMTLTGTLAAINAALDGLAFATALNFNGSAAIGVAVSDLGNSGAGGVLTAAGSVAVTVSAVNDAPANLMPPAQVTAEGTPLVLSVANGNAISISDVDAGGAAMRVTLAASNGLLTLAGTGGLVFSAGSGAGDATMTFTGTIAAINQALDGLRFDPQPLFNGPASITVNTSDQGNSGSGGVGFSFNTLPVSVAAVNNAPTLTMPGAQSVAEDTGLVFSAAGGNALVVADADAGAAPVQLTLAVAQGRLTLASVTGLTFVSGTGLNDTSMTFTGTLASINAALDGLVYRGAANYNGADTLVLQLDDLGNSGAGGALQANASVAIAVSAVNDAPTLALPAPQATTEDSALVFSSASGNAMTIADLDAGGAPVQLTLIVANGRLTLAGTGGLSFAVGTGTGDTAMTLTGTVAAINAALDGAAFMPDANFNGAAQIALSVSDLGNSGSGGALAAAGTVDVAVTAVNDGPSAAIAATGYQATESVALALQGTGLALADVDAGNAVLSASLAVGEGALYGIAGTTGVAIAGNGSGVLTLSGTLAQINALLQGLQSGQLTFLDTLSLPAAGTQLTLSVDDLGNSGAGGALTAMASVSIAIDPVNQPPVITAPLAATLAEDTPLVFSTATGNAIVLADPDAAGAPVQLTLTVNAGVLTLAGNSGITVLAGADGSAAMTLTGTVAALNAALDGARYTPDLNRNGPDVIGLLLSDLGHSGGGGAHTAAASIALQVTPVNDAPDQLSLTAVASLLENSPSGTAVARAVASDPDDSTGLVFSLTDSAQGVFRIDAATGAITVAGAGLPAMAQAGSFTFVVRVTDPAGAWLEHSYTVQNNPFMAPPPASPGTGSGGGGGGGAPVVTAGSSTGTSDGSASRASDEQNESDRRVVGVPASSAGFGGRAVAGATNLSAAVRGNFSSMARHGADSGDASRADFEAYDMFRADPLVSRSGQQAQLDLLAHRELRRAGIEAMPGIGAPMPWLVSSASQSAVAIPDPGAERLGAIATGLEAGGALFSVGALLWVTRSAGVLAAMLTALPTWRGLDPLVLLAPEQDERTSITTQRNTEAIREEADAEAIFDHLK